ncbi:MAG: hypothetical protein OEX81_02605 [Candidatus Pacebacteria bacterium]|nr:hypothetical protein [Candidatus Paceibacterota bacterium]
MNIKRLISILLIIIGLLFMSFSLVESFFYPTAFFKGIKLTVGDFVSPPSVILDKNHIVTIRDNSQIKWQKVVDYQSLSEPVYYRLSFAGKEYKVDQNYYNLNLQGLVDSQYYYKVRACDQLNNCSEWSEQGVLDIVKPFFNGEVTESDNQYQISNQYSSGFWQDNYLELNLPLGIEQLNFKYLTASNEILQGFDQTKLVVSVNDQIIYLENSVQDNWHEVKLNLSEFSTQYLKVRFYSGNQGDSKFPSWANIKDFVISPKADLDLVLPDIQKIEDKVSQYGIIY